MIDLIDYRDRGRRYKAAELEGDLLDKAVFRALLPMAMRAFPREHWNPDYVPPPELPYSTDWAAGGPIIERAKMTVWHRLEDGDDPQWNATIDGPGSFETTESGATLLQAAMRAFVARVLGDEFYF